MRNTAVHRAPAIIFEKTGHWAAGLRAALAGHEAARGSRPVRSLDLTELRSLTDLDAAVGARLARVVLLEITAASGSRVLDAVARLDCDERHIRTVVVGKPDVQCWESAARLAGASYFTTTIRKLGPVIDLLLRLPPRDAEPVSIQTQIWQSLPWGTPVRAGRS